MKIRLGPESIYSTLKMCIPVQVSDIRLPFLVKTRSQINPFDHLFFLFFRFLVKTKSRIDPPAHNMHLY